MVATCEDDAPRALVYQAGRGHRLPHLGLEEDAMLYVGVDWAEAEHAACLLDAAGAVVRRLTIPHRRAGLARLRAAIAAVEPEPAAVLVAIERPDGLLVDGLLAAGYVVYALNPKAVERYRERTRAVGRQDRPGRRGAARPDPGHGPRPASAAAAERRAGGGAARARAPGRGRRPRPDAPAEPPAPGPAGGLPGHPGRVPRPGRALGPALPRALADRGRGRALSEAELAAFLRAQGHARADAAAARIHAALHADVLAAPAHLAAARAGAIRLAARQLLLLREQRAAWEKRLRELLAGDRAHPDGEILLSLPGLDARLAARVLGEIGDRRERFPTPAALQCYAGTAPVTKASGRARVVVARTACNRFLRQALLRWAFCSLTTSAWARAYYDQHRQAGKSPLLRPPFLANRWLVILHHLLATGQRYDEAVHQRNRAHASTDTAA